MDAFVTGGGTLEPVILTAMGDRPANRMLAAAYRRRGSVAAVAGELGVAFETARQWLLAAGVELRHPGRPSPNAERARVDDLAERYRRGESVAAIAEAIDVSPNTVRNRLRAAGIQLRPRPGWTY